MTPYTRARGASSDEARLERERSVAIETLRRECPAHKPQLTVAGQEPETSQQRRGGLLGRFKTGS
jgi:hypothetical protein